MIISKAALAQYGVALVALGVTFSSAAAGAQSLAYYFSVVVGCILGLPFFLLRARADTTTAIGIALVLVLPLFTYFLQTLVFSFTGNYETSFVKAIAISTVCYISITAGLLPSARFRSAMLIVSVGHLFLLAYAIYRGDLLAAQVGEVRFSGYGLRQTVWSEVALGTIVASMLTTRLSVFALAVCAGGIVILATQMRGMGVAAFVAVVVYLSIRFKEKISVVVWYFGAFLVVAVLVLFLYAALLEVSANLLLLDDPHRGIDAGLSGRFDTWVDGLNKFLEHPFTGVGAVDPVASYTHNGYIRIFAQYGLLLGLPFLYCLFAGFKSSYSRRKEMPEILASLIAYTVFIASNLRYINFQLMPLVAIFALAYSVFGIKGTKQAPANMPSRLRQPPFVKPGHSNKRVRKRYGL